MSVDATISVSKIASLSSFLNISIASFTSSSCVYNGMKYSSSSPTINETISFSSPSLCVTR